MTNNKWLKDVKLDSAFDVFSNRYICKLHVIYEYEHLL